MNVPRLIAHRGLAKRYPENTLLAIYQALKAGARFVEFDVQLTADKVPVLFHDADLKRMTGKEGSILDLPWAEVQNLPLGLSCKERDQFVGTCIPRLTDVVYLLKDWPHASAFVEIKEESLTKFGIETVIKTLLNVLGPARGQCILISYNNLAVRCARAMGMPAIGWIIDEWDENARATATELAPDYLFCNYTKIPLETDCPLWPGPWKWALYDVDNAELALRLGHCGAHFVETMDVTVFANTPAPAEDEPH